MITKLPYKTENSTFGNVILELAEKDDRITVFDADLSRATETARFKKEFPDRYFDVGIAEANMVSMAAGFALTGKLTICGTFATFISRRVCDQIFVSCALNDANIRLIGVEPGLSSGRNGATHQAIDDMAVIRSCPGMTIIDPADATEIRQILHASLDHHGPMYLRMLRGDSPIIFDPEKSESKWGKAKHVESGKDITLICTGIMLEICLEVCEFFKKEGIEVELLHMPFIKPFDNEAVIESAKKTGRVVTAENHSIIGGLGSAVLEALSDSCPVPVTRIGIKDEFGECGEPESLFEKFGFSKKHIIKAIRDRLAEK